MTPDSGGFGPASNAIHIMQGAALLALGVAEAYAFLAGPPRKKAALAAPLVFILSSAGSAAAILYFLGGWSVADALAALGRKKGFYIFVALAGCYASAGLSRLMYLASDGKSALWHHVSLAFLAAIAALYFTMGGKVNDEVSRSVGAAHSAAGAALLAAVAARLGQGFLKPKILHAAWPAFLVTAAFQMLAYREDRSAFESRIITLQSDQGTKPSPVNPMMLSSPRFSGRIPLDISGPRPAAPSPAGSGGQTAPETVKKNAKLLDKKRAGN